MKALRSNGRPRTLSPRLVSRLESGPLATELERQGPHTPPDRETPVNMLEGIRSRESSRAGTLGDLLRRVAFAQLPSRFYGLLQLCVPLAGQLWLAGWHRSAGWCLAASSFGLWALAQQRLEGHADATAPDGTLAVRFRRGWQLLRRAAAVVGSLTALVLFAEAFAQLMATVFNCPGCAG